MRKNTFRLSLTTIAFIAELTSTACAGSAAQSGDVWQPRRLTLQGEAGADIKILRGSQNWAESCERTFTGARWDFFPYGTFRFTPGAAADVRSDLYPLTGAYRAAGDRWELHATRRNELGASLTLAGFVHGNPRAPVIEAVETTVSMASLKIVGVHQKLQEGSGTPEPKAWPSTPAKFSITLRGRIAGEPFGPLPGAASLLPPTEGDGNPLSVRVETLEQNQNGSLVWTSFLAATEPKVRFNTVTVDVAKKEIVVRMNPGVRHLLGPTWVRMSRPPEVPEIGEMADWILADAGAIRLHLDGTRLEGEISASGHGRSLDPVPYEARMEGILEVTGAAEQPAAAENPYRGEILFDGTWVSDQHGRFQLRQTGTDVQGALGAAGTEISGPAEGNVLFVRSSQKEPGLLVAVSDRHHLVAMLPESGDKGWSVTVAERPEEGTSPSTLPTAFTSREDLRDRGYALVLEGRCGEAVGVLEQAIDLYRQDRGRTDVSSLMQDGSLIDGINISTRLSYCYARLRRSKELLASLREHVMLLRLLASRDYLRSTTGAPGTQEALIGALDAYRRQLTSDLGKIQAQEESLRFFEELVDLLLELNQPGEALVAAEKGRARAFVELLVADEPMRFLPDDRIVGPGYATPLTVAGLQETARRLRSTLVEYMVTEQRLILWVLTPQGEIHVETVAVAQQDIDRWVQDLVDLMSLGHVVPRGAVRPPDASSPEAHQREILRRLYGLMVKPVEHHLPQEARVIFIPQGPLFRVPFPALLGSADQPLVERNVLSTAPAIAVLEAVHPPDSAPWAPSDVLVAGNPALPRDFRNLPDLAGAAREAQAVARIFGAQSLVGRAATKEAVVAGMQSARLIHLAGHSLLKHGDEKNFPGALVFASTSGADLLTAREIASLKLKADLAVLSACDTGGGQLTGDGVVGLSRSALAAGAKGVVVSLWKVDDAATAYLMTVFYQHLTRGEGRAHALREAMRATRNRFPDPRRWAAFTFVGLEPESGEGVSQ